MSFKDQYLKSVTTEPEYPINERIELDIDLFGDKNIYIVGGHQVHILNNQKYVKYQDSWHKYYGPLQNWRLDYFIGDL